ncbi:MAG: amidoligase family protein [Clostridia bacterium]|nr:amidoligase family protein [Clostridia bacterium]
MSKQEICVECGCVLDKEIRREFNEALYCPDCLERKTQVCSHCGERVFRNQTLQDGRRIICEDCYDDYYITCRDCGRIILQEHAFYENDEDDDAYCPDCYNRRQNAPIKEYGYKPEPIFYGSGSLFMGVEIECDLGGEDEESARELLDIANRKNEHLYIKHDGSLREGFELVSHPQSLAYHSEKMPWQEIFGKAIQLGYRSHQTTTCGLHVHVNRDAFGETPQAQENGISRLVYLVERHWSELLKFSRRTEESIKRWANRYGIRTTTKETYDAAKCNRSRYCAVNLEPRDSFEIRIFRGTLNYKTFISTLQMVEELCHLAMYFDDATVEKMSWLDIVMRIDKTKKPELVEYLQSKQLYGNEQIPEREEV